MLQGVHMNQAHGQPFPQPTFAQPSLAHVAAQQRQQQAPDAAQPQQASSRATQRATHIEGASLTINGEVPAASSPSQSNTPAQTSSNTSNIVTENLGPNAERWQMIIQSAPMQMNPNAVFNSHHAASVQAAPNGTRHPSIVSNGSVQAQTIAMNGAMRTQMPNIPLVHLQSNLSTIESSMAEGSPAPDSVFNQAREMLQSIPDLSHDTQLSLRTRIDGLASRARQLRESLHNHLIREAQEQVASQRATQDPISSAVYILSSPSGPHALLVSPSGIYTTPWHFTSAGAIPPPFNRHSIPQQSQPQFAQQQQPRDNEIQTTQARQQAPPPTDAAQVAQAQAQAQQQQQQQVNQARDLARILLPLGGHLWLMVRLFGFVYFFTAGAGWRRTILLGLAAVLVFAAQTGVFRPAIRGLWDPIQRHIEGLVPLAGNERRPPGAAGGDDGGNRTSPQSASREPTPQEAAERLLRERERRDGNLLRRGIRRTERAIALFVASLVPGVGERHIAAREAAEVARQAEAREMEEQTRRENEAARQRNDIIAPEVTKGNESNEVAEGIDPGSSSTTQNSATQAPLIEV